MCAICGCSGDHDHHEGAHDHAHPHTHTHTHTHDHAHAEPVISGRVERAARLISLERDLLAANDRIAERNRGWLRGRGILALNWVSSPGSGKTTLLERTLHGLKDRRSFAVIEGDQETDRDAARIRATGAPVLQINTGTGCHLDARMVERALHSLDPGPGTVLMIENVGNLVCPALFDLGERAKVVVASVTEGEDKPLKYPHMFRASEILLVNKIDLLPHLSFDFEALCRHAKTVNPSLRIFPVSATTGEGFEAWFTWLLAETESAHP